MTGTATAGRPRRSSRSSEMWYANYFRDRFEMWPTPRAVRVAADVAPEAVRHRVRRRIVECPVVLLVDLPETERAWLRQSQRREAQLLDENFGLRLEIRRRRRRSVRSS